MQQVIEISTNFQLSEKCDFAEVHRSGHIHNTYLLTAGKTLQSRKYILQKVNQHVFPNPEHLANNIQQVTDHIRRKAIIMGRDPSRLTITMVPTHQEDYHFHHIDGGIWRMFEFIGTTCTFEAVQNRNQVYQAGLAMGEFICMLADFPAAQLVETIPNFHHTPSRFSSFQAAVDRDSFDRVKEVLPEIDFLLARQDDISKFVDLLAEGKLPLRVTHNDTKISNVLFDQGTGNAVCLIDLDTVMPGTLLYDFGDAARTMTNTAAEDEAILSLVDFNLEYFEQLARGFIQGANDILTQLELAMMPFSAILLSLECGMRFLEDYLNGDIYFHTTRLKHNLDRARVQFRLVEGMEAQYASMEKVVRSFG